MNDFTCITCGRPIPPSKGNRPRDYCPAPDGQRKSVCQRIAQRLRELDKLIASAELGAAGLANVRTAVMRELVNGTLHAGKIAKVRRQEAEDRERRLLAGEAVLVPAGAGA